MSHAAIEEGLNTNVHVGTPDDENASEGFGSDDDFGDFEEVDQEEAPQLTATPTVEKNEDVHYYEGDYEKEKPMFEQLVNKIFGSRERDDPVGEENQFVLEDRSEKIYERLVAETESSNTGFIWKRSVIYKQMLLNLDIEERETLTQQRPAMSAHSSGAQFQNLYGLEHEAEFETEVNRLLQQVPDFKNLGFEAGSEEFNSIIDSTSETLQTAKEMLESTDLKQLTDMKSRLLQLVSVWDEHMRNTKVDNELFTSYVENLIGNTQKMRREKRILQTKTKGKSRRFRK